ncbi:MAG: hypothetical protein KGJ01_01245 [Patescibacteria group bacterium]|nr:hypothetical protein [Patescibacteria group bacterium]
MFRSLSPIKKAYIAGFLDGDGSIYARAKPNPTYRYGFQIALYIVLFQSTKDGKQFNKLCTAIGYGKIRERNDGMLECVINKINDIKEFLGCVRSFVVLKKRQVELMLKIIESKERVKNKRDFQLLLDLIDSYRDLNYSKLRIKRVLTP